jgi:hypothetical protein
MERGGVGGGVDRERGASKECRPAAQPLCWATCSLPWRVPMTVPLSTAPLARRRRLRALRHGIRRPSGPAASVPALAPFASDPGISLCKHPIRSG